MWRWARVRVSSGGQLLSGRGAQYERRELAEKLEGRRRGGWRALKTAWCLGGGWQEGQHVGKLGIYSCARGGQPHVPESCECCRRPK